MSKPETLALCIPCRANVYAQSFQYILASCIEAAVWWKAQNPENGVLILSQYRAHVAAARNELVKQALENDATWTLWFDDDAIPPTGTVTRMFSHGKKIVAPIHRKKEPPYACPAQIVVDGVRHDPPYDGGLHEVTYMGMHCALIHADVFRAIRDNLLFHPGDKWQSYVPFQTAADMGEDVFFFQAAERVGFKSYLDTGWEVDHMIESTVKTLREKEA